MKPGLWEINNKMQSSNGQLEQAMTMVHEHMAKMSPEQRKSMEEMMAKQGMQMPTVGAGGSMAVKMCMTREMVGGNEIPIQNAGNCTHKRAPVVGNTMKVSFSCSQPNASGERPGDVHQRLGLRDEDERHDQRHRQAGNHEYGCDRHAGLAPIAAASSRS